MQYVQIARALVNENPLIDDDQDQFFAKTASERCGGGVGWYKPDSFANFRGEKNCCNCQLLATKDTYKREYANCHFSGDAQSYPSPINKTV